MDGTQVPGELIQGRKIQGRKQLASYRKTLCLVFLVQRLLVQNQNEGDWQKMQERPTRRSHKLRGRSNRLLGGAAGKPGPGQAVALTLRRPPTQNKLRGRMHRSNRCGAGSPGPGQAGAPRLRRRPTRSKLRGTRTRGTTSLRRHQPPQPRAAAACGTR